MGKNTPDMGVDVDSLCSCGESFDVCQGRCEHAPEEEPYLWDSLDETVTSGEDDY